jgi:hypothetical protein
LFPHFMHWSMKFLHFVSTHGSELYPGYCDTSNYIFLLFIFKIYFLSFVIVEHVKIKIKIEFMHDLRKTIFPEHLSSVENVWSLLGNIFWQIVLDWEWWSITIVAMLVNFSLLSAYIYFHLFISLEVWFCLRRIRV